MSEKVHFGGNYRRYLKLPDPQPPASEKRPVGRPTDIDTKIERRSVSLRASKVLWNLFDEACRVQNKSRVALLELIFTSILPWLVSNPGLHFWVTAVQEESDREHEQYFAEKRAKSEQRQREKDIEKEVQARVKVRTAPLVGFSQT